MSFEDRHEKGANFECEVEQYLIRTYGSTAKNGTEHTHKDFVKLLRMNSSTASKLIRFQPDGLYYDEQVGKPIHWEAKWCSRNINIEKDAYEIYTTLESIGNIVVIFFKLDKTNQVFKCNASKIVFIDSNELVRNYSNKPDIIEGGWMKQSVYGSGTPYKRVDSMFLNVVDDFYK